jgi:hypothetical protein
MPWKECSVTQGAQTKSMGQKHGTKRSRETGEFMDQKKTGKFKSVRREKG